ncbi:uncharacterized protein LOC112567141 isoform X3 [Pomacea canaliculata]|uniref:uncharacterized protein LOC112567141 isoform X3 n=1 Tax=Pomacea canaliculata TaxID=400727 RepID=UPI000D73611A|nr:uncharacterized protein LOC112567141 isoform X3 [Pomacea canaliculata]
MFSLIKKCRKLDLPLDTQINLFDSCIKPILLYGSEIWAFESLDMCDRMQLRFLKMLLNVKSSTPTCMVLGELGTFPVSIFAKCRLLCFWYRLYMEHNSGTPKLSVLLFHLCNSLADSPLCKPSWVSYVRSLLDSLGFSTFWKFGCSFSPCNFKNIVMQRLKDQFIQKWKQEIYTNEICTAYRMFKEYFIFENYLIDLPPALRSNLIKFRLSCHKLPIQQLRYSGIPRYLRTCPLCNLDEVGDEFHYLFVCTHHFLVASRRTLLPVCFVYHPSEFGFQQLMSVGSSMPKEQHCLERKESKHCRPAICLQRLPPESLIFT